MKVRNSFPFLAVLILWAMTGIFVSQIYAASFNNSASVDVKDKQAYINDNSKYTAPLTSGSITYTLSNPGSYEVRYTRRIVNDNHATGSNQVNIWALIPQNTESQQITDFTFNTEPKDYLYDRWGQKAAHYMINNLGFGEEYEICWTAKIQTSSIQYHVDPQKVGNLDDIQREVIDIYTGDDVKYNLRSKIVQKAAKTAAGNATNLYDRVKNIHDYVIKNLEYKIEGGWDDAAVVLERGNGSCSEYSYAFIALCRANGIPARFTGGTRIRADGYYEDSLFHKSAEVYLPPYGWLPVDITRDDTQKYDQHRYFFALDNSFLIIAKAGGTSDLLGWNSHSYTRWSTSPTSVTSTNVAIWQAQ